VPPGGALPDGVQGGAVFSDDGRFRYWLVRRWDGSLPRCTFVLLNPSAAGADADDPTNRRLRALTTALGCGAYELVNLFARVDTHQHHLLEPDAVGASTAVADGWIASAVHRADTVVLGWGDGRSAGAGGRARRVAVARRAASVWPLVADHRPQCLTVNRSGQPGHPLYRPVHSPLLPYRPGAPPRAPAILHTPTTEGPTVPHPPDGHPVDHAAATPRPGGGSR